MKCFLSTVITDGFTKGSDFDQGPIYFVGLMHNFLYTFDLLDKWSVTIMYFSPAHNHVRNVFMVSRLLSHRIKLFETLREARVTQSFTHVVC